VRLLRQLHRRLPDRRAHVQERVRPREAGTWNEDEQTVTTTICTFCGVGCNLELHEQDNEIVKVTSPLDHPVTGGNLCIKGRFGFQFVQNDRGDLPPPREQIPPGPPAPAEARDGHNGDGFVPRTSDPAG
jgi:molybdopterin-dependent oxidoreductase iron-sulfur protein